MNGWILFAFLFALIGHGFTHYDGVGDAWLAARFFLVAILTLVMGVLV